MEKLRDIMNGETLKDYKEYLKEYYFKTRPPMPLLRDEFAEMIGVRNLAEEVDEKYVDYLEEYYQDEYFAELGNFVDEVADFVENYKDVLETKGDKKAILESITSKLEENETKLVEEDKKIEEFNHKLKNITKSFSVVTSAIFLGGTLPIMIMYPSLPVILIFGVMNAGLIGATSWLVLGEEMIKEKIDSLVADFKFKLGNIFGKFSKFKFKSKRKSDDTVIKEEKPKKEKKIKSQTKDMIVDIINSIAYGDDDIFVESKDVTEESIVEKVEGNTVVDTKESLLKRYENNPESLSDEEYKTLFKEEHEELTAEEINEIVNGPTKNKIDLTYVDDMLLEAPVKSKERLFTFDKSKKFFGKVISKLNGSEKRQNVKQAYNEAVQNNNAEEIAELLSNYGLVKVKKAS